MFEQSLLIDGRTNKSWSVVISISGQLLFVTAAALTPLVFTDRLSMMKWVRTYVAPSAAISPVTPVSAPSRVSATTLYPVRAFSAPTRIPSRVMIMEEFQAPTTGVSSLGVPGGTGDVLSLVPVVPAPAPVAQPKPVEVIPELKPIQVGGQVQAAKIVRRVIPVYPPLAKQARISGTVRLVGIISRDGTIRSLELVNGPPMLVKVAIDAVKQWVYQPTLLNGQPVEVIAPIDVVFTLTN